VDLHLLVRPCDLPWVGTTEPVVRLLALPTALEGLPEHAVLVAQPVSHRRQLHRCHRVEKARGETSEPAVSQTGIGLGFEQAQPLASRQLRRFADEGTDEQIGDVVGQRASDQEFHREVVHALGILPFVGLLREHPPLREDVPDGARQRLVPLACTNGCRIGHVVKEQMPLIEGIRSAGQPHRAAAILPHQGVQRFQGRC
jgi:hypothetical protein